MEDGDSDDNDSERDTFVNISFTPLECSIIAPSKSIHKLFPPCLELIASDLVKSIIFSDDDYIAMQIDGEGIDTGDRLLSLTTPIAAAGISIHFISSYFSDYVLFKRQWLPSVIETLEKELFVFESHSASFISTPAITPSASMHFDNKPFYTLNEPLLDRHDTGESASVKSPATSTNFTQETLRRLFDHGGEIIVGSEPVVHCGGRAKLRDDPVILSAVTSLFYSPQRPSFLSLTITGNSPPSLLLPATYLRINTEDVEPITTRFPAEHLNFNSSNVLLPLMIDLSKLELEYYGIICAIVSKLVEVQREGDAAAAAIIISPPRTENLEDSISSLKSNASGAMKSLTYLSTMFGGNILLDQADAQWALRNLNS